MINLEKIKKIVKDFEDVSIDLATYRANSDYYKYENIRNELINEPIINSIIPDWVLQNRYGSSFWLFIKKYPSYQERRDFIRSSLNEIYNFIDFGYHSPVSISVKEIVDTLNNNNIESLWRKVQLRKNNDPEGAITAASTMLETSLKYILDKRNIEYTNKGDIFDLYKKVFKELNLSPTSQDEQVFKQIFQGITSVVSGISSLRNKYGDVHGKSLQYKTPNNRHANFVINLSGSMCIFLLETFNEINTKK